MSPILQCKYLQIEYGQCITVNYIKYINLKQQIYYHTFIQEQIKTQLVQFITSTRLRTYLKYMIQIIIKCSILDGTYDTIIQYNDKNNGIGLAQFWLINLIDFIPMIQTKADKSGSVSNYFAKYRQVVTNHTAETGLAQGVSAMIQKQIDAGRIKISNTDDTISSNIHKLTNEINQKNQKLSRSLVLLSMNMDRSLYLKRRSSARNQAKQSTRSLRRLDTQMSNQLIDQYRNQQINSFKRLHNLKKVTQQLKKQRELQQLEKKLKQEKRNVQLYQQQIQQQHLKRVDKLNKISERIKKLQQNRVERIERLKTSVVKSTPTLPKYKLMRYQFDAKQINFQQKQKQKLQQKKMHKMIENSATKIKQHQSKYNKVVEDRKKSNSLISKKQPQNVIQLQKYYNVKRQNPQKFQQLRTKSIRIKQYQGITNQNRKYLKQDPKIGKQIEAAIDKSKHPFKYHYLKKKKNLTDLQIYENYNQFNFNSDPTQMGNMYLQQIKFKNNQSRISLKSEKRVKTDSSHHSQRKNYKNYLQDSKKHALKRQSNQIDQLMRLYGQKSKVLQILQQKANGQVQKALKKIVNLKTPNNYSKTLEIQQQIDDNFINSIKTRLKCLQIK